MADHHEEDDFAPTQTAGYKVGEKKTLDEYKNLDAQDESLNKWKESLGLKTGGKRSGPADDDRRVVVEYIALEVEGRPDVKIDLSTPDAIDKARSSPFIIKEGVEYRMKVKFRVQHDVVSGLKYLQVVKRKGVRVDKTEEMIGSYGPAPEPYEKKFQLEEAPSGLLARGHYEAKSKFVDDDNVTHIEWAWSFDIKKDW
ncbi:immunoglobulin E-set [Fennellomyces sp. T-0311]|nr:immunoglobulin E-set [Fennellomyces sp. T-0311]